MALGGRKSRQPRVVGLGFLDSDQAIAIKRGGQENELPMRFCPQCGGLLSENYIDGRNRLVCPACDFIFYQNPKLAVGVIPVMDGKVLLNRRNVEPGLGAWTFPSGYVDAGEKVEEAAVREVKEEVGVEVRLDRLLGVYSEKGNPVVLVVYVGTVIEGQPTSGKEALQVKAFDPPHWPDLAFDHDAQILQDWLDSMT